MAKKILIVEDEETILELLSETFGDVDDYIVLLARDGEEALRIIRSDKPNIILLDILLPKINGYEVCKSVKSDPTIANTKIIMISGMAQTYDWQKAQEAAADAYITKPFSLNVLIEKVEELLRSN